jgi:phosphoribosylglycinamide formyltransferase-1
MGSIIPPSPPIHKIGLAVLISGRGSNLQALIDACNSDAFPAEIKIVISNIPDAYGLTRAKEHKIPTRVISHTDFATKGDFEKRILSILNDCRVDLVCLAGFMRILTPTLIKPWEGQILNIHPSLLPKYKGLNTHERSIAAGDTETGCTVHLVTPAVDEGEIICQRRVPIAPDDTPDTLAAKVLEQEHIAYPEAIKIMASRIQKIA